MQAAAVAAAACGSGVPAGVDRTSPPDARPQDEADVWCAPRPPPSFPPTTNQLRQMRVAIVVDQVCRK